MSRTDETSSPKVSTTTEQNIPIANTGNISQDNKAEEGENQENVESSQKNRGRTNLVVYIEGGDEDVCNLILIYLSKI